MEPTVVYVGGLAAPKAVGATAGRLEQDRNGYHCGAAASRAFLKKKKRATGYPHREGGKGELRSWQLQSGGL